VGMDIFLLLLVLRVKNVFCCYFKFTPTLFVSSPFVLIVVVVVGIVSLFPECPKTQQ
jgi:hypothetical protein